MEKIKIIAVSDTHSEHNDVTPLLREADIFLHGGDFTVKGTREETRDFCRWISDLPYKHKIFIAGNHDIFAETNRREMLRMLGSDVIYLENEDITVLGLKIFGSPVTCRHGSKAFAKDRGLAMRQYWRYVPSDTDILLTHMPAKGLLDVTSNGDSFGCVDLRRRIEAVKPKAAVCGHIHGSAGQMDHGDVKVFNVAFLANHRKDITYFEI